MSPQRSNLWLRYGGPPLVIFGIGYVLRASDEREYATEGLHRVLVVLAALAVLIGVIVWIGDQRNDRNH